ncbi:hypothetical protein HYH03_000417 [Edaphochlamys debaryana]|uniref:Uncharacterized protein n=1 Tax=Edaphochlamys debaryana TaxID=47281 RepID=A0A835YQC4_9CHLO|nr:hypothetical protein HYH03_000417 [Edaphochlamys debaryana]|eukprot:KAG2501919.1 hypothetical protein HYH03_000417 [Edaphochlamys debaryana]
MPDEPPEQTHARQAPSPLPEGTKDEAQPNTSVVVSGLLAARCSVVLDLLEAVAGDALGTTPANVTVPGVPASISARGLQVLESWAGLQPAPPPPDEAAGAAPAPVAPFPGYTGEALLAFLLASGCGDPVIAAEAAQAAAFLGCGSFLRLGLELQLLRYALADEDQLGQGLQLSRAAQERVLTQEALELLPSVRPAGAQPAAGGGNAALQARRLPLEDFEAVTAGLCGSDWLRELEPRPEVVRSVLCGLDFQPEVTADREEGDRMSDGKEQYLALPLPLAVLRDYEVIRLQLQATAHDQGWSSYPDDHNTTNNSWTWGELALLLANAGPDVVLPARPDGYGRAYTNLHAVKEWQEHSVQLGPDAAIVQDLNRLGEGLEGAGPEGAAVWLQFLIAGIFPGWTHFINRASLSVVLRAR